jgi:glutamate-ammonia-ligase adenylyltransferase
MDSMTDTGLLCSDYSRFAARMLDARGAELAERIRCARARPLTRAALEARLDALGGGPLAGEEALRRALRQWRTEVFCMVMERDLAGLADVGEVTAAMSDMAEIAIERALACAQAGLHARYGLSTGPDGEPQCLAVVGMGKLGGRELNVSSDVDLIFVYEDDGDTDGGERAALAKQDFFTRVGRKLIGLLSEVTADGYVFRVDMRLRPNGESGPLVCSLAMLEEYFYVQGREWERYAWIKGRVVSGMGSAAATRLAAQLDRLVMPFVYRRYLDYGVIAALRGLHAQIRHEAAKRALARPERADDVKLGRGGIREIEFSAQSFQLVRGGQDPGFRTRATLDVLTHAASQQLLAPDVAARLRDAYVFLRQVEHRLQYMDDAQTHALPLDGDDRARLARSLGYDDYDAFYQALTHHRDCVEEQFDAIFSDKSDEAAPYADAGEASDVPAAWGNALERDDALDALGRRLAALGFDAPRDTAGRLLAVRLSARYQQLPEASRARFDLLVRRAIDASCRLEPPALRDQTLSRGLDLLEAVSRRSAYLALLTEFPAALDRVLSVMAASSWAARYLINHPQLLDELLDDAALGVPPNWDAFKAGLRARLAAVNGAEQKMDALRHAHHAEVFRILLLDLGRRLSVEAVSDLLSALADAILALTLEAVWSEMPRRHRDVPLFAVIAYGKLGGKELGYASDLDLIFLYDDPDDVAAENYARFGRRLITWLSTSTGAGQLFDIDLRLRPSGESGLLVTELQAFRRYELREAGSANAAWVWEHQALTRARYCAGDARIGADFEAIRDQVLALPREAAALAGEIVAMRRRVREGHRNRSALFDLKHDAGGMIDIEFIVQYLVLLHARAYPALLANRGNIALLREMAALGLLDESAAAQAAGAYRIYRRLQHRLRLDGMSHARVAPEQVANEREAVIAVWRQVFATD